SASATPLMRVEPLMAMLPSELYGLDHGDVHRDELGTVHVQRVGRARLGDGHARVHQCYDGVLDELVELLGDGLVVSRADGGRHGVVDVEGPERRRVRSAEVRLARQDDDRRPREPARHEAVAGGLVHDGVLAARESGEDGLPGLVERHAMPTPSPGTRLRIGEAPTVGRRALRRGAGAGVANWATPLGAWRRWNSSLPTSLTARS